MTTLKSHYRKLVVENHPDKLIARGVPREFVAIATRPHLFHEFLALPISRFGLSKPPSISRRLAS